MSDTKDIVASLLSAEERITLIRVANLGQALNTNKENPFLTVAMARERGTGGVTMYTHTECGKQQLVSLIKGFLSLLEADQVTISTIL